MANATRRSAIHKPKKSGFKLTKKQKVLLDDILTPIVTIFILLRSEERRVGKEC